MLLLLKEVEHKYAMAGNAYVPQAKLLYMDSLLRLEHSSADQIAYCKYLKANILMELGEEDKAIKIYEELARNPVIYQTENILKDLAIAYLRVGERSNCISNHAAESCVMPVRGLGVHRDTLGSRMAIRIYEKLLERNINDYESRWLLNLAYMTLGEYPEKVPKAFLLPGMEGDTTVKVNPFTDIAAGLNLNPNNMAGGSLVEDLDNDGYLDIFISCWGLEENVRYYKNNADGSFTELTDQAGLRGITGGLNVAQGDYNNDGNMDILILRGAWKGEFGLEPNSLLRNNGDGTFTDITIKANLLSLHPTQTATWNDFNNDGWLDLFVGNETTSMINPHPCQLFINLGNETFEEIGAAAKCDYRNFVKGVTSGDYDNDGRKDLFLSTMDGNNRLLRNVTTQPDRVVFEDVSEVALIRKYNGVTFPTWFWDFNNDGWMDIYTCNFTIDKTLAFYAGAEKLGIETLNTEKMYLFSNNQDGTFTETSKAAGLDKITFAMGSNFGDINNDGFLDMYLGTGNPSFKSLIPNKLYLNLKGEKFADVTSAARVGHLQKGHGVSLADLDNDGDQDIYIELGGAYSGDAYQNALFLNPGQGSNNWICIQLEGTKANRAAIGTRLKIKCTEDGVSRTIYRDVNSGGSFGASPLRREIGLGKATKINELEISWHGSNTVQVFKNIQANQFIKIKEGDNTLQSLQIKKINWILPDQLCLPTL
ncbi:MAG TPA: FG-GAP-like repeat-containing protein [Ohtaekwangia sp.]